MHLRFSRAASADIIVMFCIARLATLPRSASVRGTGISEPMMMSAPIARAMSAGKLLRVPPSDRIIPPRRTGRK